MRRAADVVCFRSPVIDFTVMRRADRPCSTPWNHAAELHHFVLSRRHIRRDVLATRQFGRRWARQFHKKKDEEGQKPGCGPYAINYLTNQKTGKLYDRCREDKSHN